MSSPLIARPVFVVACSILSFAVLTSCAPSSNNRNGGGRQLRFSISGDPTGFDPLHCTEENGETVRYIIGGVLVRVNRATDVLEPVLADSWKVGDGGRSIAFHLRDQLKFSDGSPLTADDVARTLRTALDPKEASPVGDTFRSEKGDPEIHVLSPVSLVIRYPQPKPGLERLFDQLAIAPRSSTARFAPSAGPFYVAEYKAASYILLARNPHFSPLAKLESVRLDIQQNREIEVAEFLKGNLQLVNNLEPDGFNRVKTAMPAAATNLGPSLSSEFLWFNQTPSPVLPEFKRQWFRSAAFRHAISVSIHRDDISRIVYKGYAHPAAGPFSPGNRFWFNTSLRPRPYDASLASKYLQEAGFSLREGVLLDSGGHVVEFSLVTNADNKARQQTAAVIQADLKKIGIKVNLVPLDFGSLLARIVKTFDYEACLLGFANVGIDPMEQNNVWLSSGPQHAWWPSQKTPATPWEAEIDRLMLAQSTEADRSLRKRDFDRVQQIAYDQEPILYLVNRDFLSGISPSLRGVQPVPVPPQLIWNIEKLGVQ